MAVHKAPWGIPLITISSVSSLLCFVISAWLAWSWQNASLWAILVPLAILVIAALFVVRSYTVEADAILIQRSFWKTRIPLVGLQSVWHDPMAMTKSSRTFGNGGLFSFCGHFRNKLLGPFLAYVNDPHRAVILDYGDSKVVLSPEVPQRLIDEIAAIHPVSLPKRTPQ